MKLCDEKTEDKILQSPIPVLIEFYADWCGPCKVMKPILKEIKKALKDKAKILTIDVEEHPKLTDKFTVLSLPTFVIYCEGEKIKTLTGIQKKEYLMAMLLNR